MPSTLRDRIFQNGAVPTERVTITLGGEPAEVEVRGLTAGARGELMTSCVKQDAEGNAVTDVKQLQPALVIASTYDPATGERVFSEADLEALLALRADLLDPIITSASKLSGLSEAAKKTAEKNSDATAISTSGSPSLES